MMRFLGFCFACYVLFWSSVLNESWKHKNAMLNLWWGTIDSLKDEKERPWPASCASGKEESEKE